MTTIRDVKCVIAIPPGGGFTLEDATAKEDVDLIEDGFLGVSTKEIVSYSRGTWTIRGKLSHRGIAVSRVEVCGAKLVRTDDSKRTAIVLHFEARASMVFREDGKPFFEREREDGDLRVRKCETCGVEVFEKRSEHSISGRAVGRASPFAEWRAVLHFAPCGLLCGASPAEESTEVETIDVHALDRKNGPGCRLCGSVVDKLRRKP